MRFLLVIILSHIPLLLSAQLKGDYVWVSGIQNHENLVDKKGFVFDFNQKPMSIDYQKLTYGFYGSRGSICDEWGNLLFYSNGRGVLNADHQLMPNGDSINWGLFAEFLWPTMGNGYPGIQDIIILRDPDYHEGYYLLHKYINESTPKTSFYYKWLQNPISSSLGKIFPQRSYGYACGIFPLLPRS